MDVVGSVGAALLAAFAVLTWPGRNPHRWPGGLREVLPERPADPDPSVYAAADALDLLALALRAGLAPVEALEEVAARVGGVAGGELAVVAAAHRWGEEPEVAWQRVSEAWRPAALAWRAAVSAGVAPAGLLESAAAQLRRAEDDRLAASMQRAGVLLVLPLGLCFLPGFVGTSVVPVVLHLADALLRV